MNTARLFSLSGICLILGGAARALFWLLVVPFETFAGAATALNSLEQFAQVFNVLGAALVIYGFLGLYAAHHRQMRTFGLVGFALALLGGMGVLADALIGLVIFPSMATAAPATIEPDGAFFVGNILGLYVAIFATNMIGQTSFGFALWKYTSLPRVALGLFLASAILANLPPLPVLHYVLIAGGVAGGTGMVWLGWALRRLASRAVPERG